MKDVRAKVDGLVLTKIVMVIKSITQIIDPYVSNTACVSQRHEEAKEESTECWMRGRI